MTRARSTAPLTWIRYRLTGNLARRPGQIMILFALMLPALIAMAALATDIAYVYADRRELQAGADLAALAGANELPGSASAAKSVAVTYAAKNGWSGGGVTITTVTPYNGDPNRIEVTITHNAPTFFARIFGVNTVNVSARAVAFREVGNGYAIFAKQHCNNGPVPSSEVVDWSGSSGTVKGKVHSNGGYKQGGSSNTVQGSVGYVCESDVSGSNNHYSSGLNQSGVLPMPINFTASDFPCTYNIPGGDLNAGGAWWQSSNTLKPGVYCATGLLKLSRSDVTGNVTFVAKGSSGMVEISGSNNSFTPFTKGVAAYSEGVGKDYGMKLGGSGVSWTGMLWAGDGRIEISGQDNFTLAGSVIAATVKLNGSSWSIDNSGSGKSRARLAE